MHCQAENNKFLSSSWIRYGIAAVKQAIRATLDTENTPLRCVDDPAIALWEIQYPFSVKEFPRSADGGVNVLLHIAGLYSGNPITSSIDSARVRVFLADLLAPPSPLTELNFFGLGGSPPSFTKLTCFVVVCSPTHLLKIVGQILLVTLGT